MNFPLNKQGIVVGLQLLFYGLSGTFFAQFFYFLFSNDPNNINYSGFILFIFSTTLVINVLGVILMAKNPPLAVVHPEAQSLPNYDSLGEEPIPSHIDTEEVIGMKSRESQKLTRLSKSESINEFKSQNSQSIARNSSPNIALITPTISNSTPSLSFFQILQSPSFWFYLLICIFAQGITYMSNVTSIVISINETASVDWISQTSALQVTIISIGQSVGR